MSQDYLVASAVLTNDAGMHARPSVKLTQLARSFTANIEVATDSAGPWVDAKSPVKLMRFRAPQGATLWLRAAGEDAQRALDEVLALVAANFGEGAHG
ncbi:HPr family phosphocarrier protein [Aquamicrobium sp. NLF2-7]|uniref:HPr family phosphocarrier protein n=1 Tax=Aquamicrobium sp. NLF2-7 TaxID=2918753 RepID=UPI001EFB7B73|nr:HPr family phosphocarrier protein [Aquamicrobium sp. NLF2-7]MCG8273266.1 HPr family phosphocarrier protein [Aquamicrobium sp. NLF2-7]